MKTILLFLFASSFITTNNNITPKPSDLYGAWETSMTIDGKEATMVKIITPNYFITSIYAKSEYLGALGGTWTLEGSAFTETFEFYDPQNEKVGTAMTIDIEMKGNNNMVSKDGGSSLSWKRLDDGKSELFGAWRITGRERNGEMSQMQMGPRKTFKILSGTRFQWAAYNVETKQFSGSGGGTYTIKDGKYTENIEVFSRDNSRVGASLEFQYEVKGKEWHHSGLSSRGQAIYEIWTNQDN